MLLRIEGEDELSLFFEIMSLSPQPEDMADQEKSVVRTVRWWFMTGQNFADPEQLAAPFLGAQHEIAVSILSRLAAGLKVNMDGPSLSRARVARRLLQRNPELSKLAHTEQPE